MRPSSEAGFSLAEVMIALGILMVGVFGAAAVMTAGMQNLSSSPADVVVIQKAADAVEAVFTARDSGKLPWSQVRNVHGESGSDGGAFVDGPQPLKLAGPDGLVNTADDTTAETVTLPGSDLTTASDDTTVVLGAYTREIAIRDVPDENGQLRKITVTVTYQNGSKTRSYVLITLISSYF